jgi:hypothetical protein
MHRWSGSFGVSRVGVVMIVYDSDSIEHERGITECMYMYCYGFEVTFTDIVLCVTIDFTSLFAHYRKLNTFT